MLQFYRQCFLLLLLSVNSMQPMSDHEFNHFTRMLAAVFGNTTIKTQGSDPQNSDEALSMRPFHEFQLFREVGGQTVLAKQE
ncbi:hypothetical protein Btru_043856 [Bulinus truncatus]|nr:hypothetical protein Btru_043856 [Bulinus truncatus]